MSDLLKALVGLLDYALKDGSDELKLEVVVFGASMEEHERSDLSADENFGGLFNEQELSEFSELSTLEFSTVDDLSGERMTREDLEEVRDLLAGKKKGGR